MTRDDLYAHYRRFYVPCNATLVVVGDVEADQVLRQVERYFGRIPAGRAGAAPGRRAAAARRAAGPRGARGDDAILKFGYHAPAATDPDFFPMLVLDAILTGAKGVNLWSSFRVAPPQRKSRLYTALFERRLASQVNGALLATADPFLYTLSFTPNEGVAAGSRGRLLSARTGSRGRHRGQRGDARQASAAGAAGLRGRQRHQRVAHQLGFFETVVGPGFYSKVQPCIDAVTPDQVRDVARRRLRRSSLTVGTFQPLESN